MARVDHHGDDRGSPEPPERCAYEIAQRRRLNLAPSLHRFSGATLRRETGAVHLFDRKEARIGVCSCCALAVLLAQAANFRRYCRS